MRGIRPDLTACAACPRSGAPCDAGAAFLDRLGQCLALAARATGAVPEMDGEVTLRDCRGAGACVLRWRAAPDGLSLAMGERVLLRGRLVAQALQ